MVVRRYFTNLQLLCNKTKGRRMYDLQKIHYARFDNLQCNCLGNNTSNIDLLAYRHQADTNHNTNPSSHSSSSNLKQFFKTSLRRQKSSNQFAHTNKSLKMQNPHLEFRQTPQQIQENFTILDKQQSVRPQLKQKLSGNTNFWKEKQSLKITAQLHNQKQPQKCQITMSPNPKASNQLSQFPRVNSQTHHQTISPSSYSQSKLQIYPELGSLLRKPMVNFSFPTTIKSTPILQQCDNSEQQNGESVSIEPKVKVKMIQQKIGNIKLHQTAQLDNDDDVEIQFKDEINKYLGQSLQLPSRGQNSQDIKVPNLSSILNKNVVHSQINNKKSLVETKKTRVENKQYYGSLKRMQDVEEIKSVADSNLSVSDKESIVLGRMNHGSMVEPKIHYSTDLSHLSSVNIKFKQR